MAAKRDARVSQLMDIGLNRYQALVYLALLETGEGDAHRISQLSGVPRTRIYQTCQALQELDLVDVTTDRPIRYRARPLEGYLRRLAQNHLSAAQRIEAQTHEMAEAFRPKPPTPADRMEQRFLTIKGRDRARESLLQALARTRKWATISAPPAVLQLFAQHLTANPPPKGATVQLLTTLTPSNLDAVKALPSSVEVRHGHEPYPASCVVVDGREGVQARFTGEKEADLSIALWTNSRDLVENWQRAHEDGWRLASPLHDYASRGDGADGAGHFIIARGREQAQQLAHDTTLAPGTRIDAWLPELDSDYLTSSFPQLRACKVRVLTPVTDRSAPYATATAQWAEVRHAPFPIEFGLAVREQALSFTTFSGAPAIERVEHTLASTGPKLTRTMLRVFDALWEQATPLGERLRELGLASPAPSGGAPRSLPIAWPKRQEPQ